MEHKLQLKNTNNQGVVLLVVYWRCERLCDKAKRVINYHHRETHVHPHGMKQSRKLMW